MRDLKLAFFYQGLRTFAKKAMTPARLCKTRNLEVCKPVRSSILHVPRYLLKIFATETTYYFSKPSRFWLKFELILRK